MTTQPSPEAVEKARQGIMRMRELLDILQVRLDEGEQAYQRFFAKLSPDETEGLREKEIQRLAAYSVLDDPTLITDPALHLRFVMRDLERDFEQLHDHFVIYDEDEA